MLVASTAPGLAMRSRAPNTCCLTRHVLEHRFDHDVGVGDRGEVGGAGDAGEPRLHLVRREAPRAPRCDNSWPPRRGRGRAPRHWPRPRSRECRHWQSTWRCRRPWCRRRSPPRAGCRGASRPASSGSFAASRSAKKMWRWAFDCSPATRSRNSARSRASACSTGSVIAPRSASIAAAGAVAAARTLEVGGRGGVEFFAGRRDRRRACRRGSSPAPARGLAPTIPRANATAAAARSPSTMASIRPASSASVGRDRIAGQDHRHRLVEADEARQALGAAGAGDQAELDLGQAEPCARRRHPEMAAERDFEAAAERRAVHRGDHRLFARLDRRDHVERGRLSRRLAELADVGAGNEGAPGADDDDRGGAGIRPRPRHRIDETGPQREAQRIDRRIVDGDDGDIAVIAQRTQARTPGPPDRFSSRAGT